MLPEAACCDWLGQPRPRALIQSIRIDGPVLSFEKEIGMLRAKLVIFAAIALLFAQVQCAVACVDQVCGSGASSSESTPPCHRHHHPSHHVANSCTREITFALSSSQTMPAKFPFFGAPVAPMAAVQVQPAGRPNGASDFLISSPPGIVNLTSVVLRI